MAVRESYKVPQKEKSVKITSFEGKYKLKERAGLNEVDKEAYVIPLDLNNGYANIPHHTVRTAAEGQGFKRRTYDVKIACHRFDKITGEVSSELPLCCQLAKAEQGRISDKDKSNYRAISFVGFRKVIPLMVLSTTETDPSKKASMKKLSVKNGIDFSFMDMAGSTYEDFIGDIKGALEAEGTIDEDTDDEEISKAIMQYLQNSIIKITTVASGKIKVPYVKKYRAIPINNQMVAKESGEQKLIACVLKVINGTYPAAKLDALFEKHPEIKAINNQVIDYLEVFNTEVDSLAIEWTDSELQEYYNKYLEQQGVVDSYKSKPSEETVSFTNDTAKDEEDDIESELEAVEDELAAEEPTPAVKKAPAKVAAKAKVETEDDFDFSTAELEESSILEDEEFQEDDFMMEEGDEL